jgi:hypothetical protein
MTQEQLDALPAEVLTDRQRLVDAAVRYAREHGLCGEFERALRVLMPEMSTTDQYGDVAWYDTDGVSCRGYQPEGAVPVFNEAGYDREGWDRDGFNRYGINRDGKTRYQVEHANDEPVFRFGADGFDEGGRDFQGYNRDGFDPDGFDRSGYSRNTGTRRRGREATVEELSTVPEVFNPTTYKPAE